MLHGSSYAQSNEDYFYTRSANAAVNLAPQFYTPGASFTEIALLRGFHFWSA